ncbi:MAG: Zn-dependent hydrolase [Anaerolineaceae bacterium]|jgi:hydantoinase/carbamoylase family amidase|nr:Zn-dependent hydrolase [Anaerolineaceae bacterium]
MFHPEDIDMGRMLGQLSEISSVSSSPDGGVTRCTFNPAFLASMSLVAGWMNEIGLEVRFDRWGNLYGRYACAGGGSSILAGSHLDSVQNGGNFDGLLGVLSALEAVRLIKQAGIELAKDIEIVAFIEEEGNVFQKLLLGSLLATGQISKQEISGLQNEEGEAFLDILKKIQFPYPVEPEKTLHENVESYLELHLEQARLLETNQKSVGLVTSIAGLKVFRVDLIGQADHAGSTAYADRRDTLLAAAEMITALRRIGLELFPSTARITVAKIEVIPGMTNVVAGETVFNIDTRSADVETAKTVESEIRSLVSKLSEKHQLKYDIQVLSDSPAVITATRMRKAIEKGIEKSGLDQMDLVSWAVHDALALSKVTDVGMIFVRCLDGRSHCPEEFVSPEDIADGTAVFANTLIELASTT